MYIYVAFVACILFKMQFREALSCLIEDYSSPTSLESRSAIFEKDNNMQIILRFQVILTSNKMEILRPLMELLHLYTNNM